MAPPSDEAVAPLPTAPPTRSLRRLVVELSTVAALALAVLGFAALVGLVRLEPFSTSGDSYVYHLPVIKLASDPILRGEWPRMSWQLGSGFSPLSSGQAGLLYPPYWVANLLARALGRPFALLEVSGWLHLWLAGVFCFLGAERSWSVRERGALGLLAAFQPAPFLLGINWHDYVSPYPWFLGCLFSLQLELASGQSSHLRRLALLASSALFFSAAHPQMYVLGVLFAAGFCWARAGRASLVTIGVWLAAQLPFVVPLLYLRGVAAGAAAHWMAGRASSSFVLTEAQPLDTVLWGALFGNLAGTADFQLWLGVAASGIGLFFSPALVFSLVDAIGRRRYRVIAFLAACLLVMGIASFPLLRYLVPSSLGFRWTWKLMLLLGPAALLLAARTLPERLQRARLRLGALLIAAFLSLLTCLVGLDFNLTPGFEDVDRLGVSGLVAETERLLQQAGVPAGARLAHVSTQSITDRGLPIPILGTMGNAPPLAGYETAHLYEPLESAELARSHLGLSIQWRVSVSPAWYRSDPERAERALAAIGVDALLSADPRVFEGMRATSVVDALNRTTFVRVFEHTAPAFPWAETTGAGTLRERVELERVAGGRLETKLPLPSSPRLVVPQPVVWSRLADGRWRATPEGVSLQTLASFLLSTALSLALLLIPLRRLRSF